MKRAPRDRERQGLVEIAIPRAKPVIPGNQWQAELTAVLESVHQELTLETVRSGNDLGACSSHQVGPGGLAHGNDDAPTVQSVIVGQLSGRLGAAERMYAED